MIRTISIIPAMYVDLALLKFKLTLSPHPPPSLRGWSPLVPVIPTAAVQALNKKNLYS